MQQKKKDSLILQAGILAVAGLITRIIGLFYRGPLTNIIGDAGNGAYGTAYTIYAMILLVSSYSIPMAVSKVMAAKLALNEYRNAHRIFLCSLLYVIVIGSIASIATFFFSSYLNQLGKPNAVLALQILSPTIFFSGILGVFRGYFQAQNTMIPTSLSQIIEQIFNAIGSIVAAYLFTLPYVSTNNTTAIIKYGAAGGALGTGIGVLSGLFFCILIYLKKRKQFQQNLKLDTTNHLASYGTIIRTIVLMVTPVILSTFIYNISSSVDMLFFYRILQNKGLSNTTTESMYGIFTGKYDVLVKVPVALASATAATLIPSVSGLYARQDIAKTNAKIEQSIQFTMILAIPSAIGLAILAKPIMNLIFYHGPSQVASNNDLAANLVMFGAISIVFYSLSTITNGVLQGIGRMRVPVINATKALVIHLVVLVALLYTTDWNLYVLVISSIVYSGSMCILNGFSVKKYLGLQLNRKKLFMIPLISSLIMGCSTVVVYYGLKLILHPTIVVLSITIVISMLVYFICMIKMGGVSEQDLLSLPKGSFLIRVSKKLKLM